MSDGLNLLNKKHKHTDFDIIITGKSNINKYKMYKRIKNKLFLEYNLPNNKKYNIDYDTIKSNNSNSNSKNYSFIEDFYKDINLNLSIFFEYFYIPQTYESVKLYKLISSYYIVFIQSTCSKNISLNISNILKKYINEDKVILICSDKNLYNKKYNSYKYEIANKFIFAKLAYYIDTIKNSDEIYIIDSCFTGIVLPYLKTNKLKANTIERNIASNFIL